MAQGRTEGPFRTSALLRALAAVAASALGCGGAGAGRDAATVVVPPASPVAPPGSASPPRVSTAHASLRAEALFDAGGRVLALQDGWLSLLEGGSVKGSTRRRLPEGVRLFGLNAPGETPVAGDVVLAARGPALLAFDANTLGPRWENALDGGAPAQGAYADGVIVLSLSRPAPGAPDARRWELAGLDAGSGHTLWSRPAPAASYVWAAAGRAFVCQGDAGFRALNARSGATLWARSGARCPTAVAADGADVALASGDELFTLDAATGALRHRVPLGALNRPGEMALADGQLYAHVAPKRDDAPRRVVRVSLATGMVVWSAPTGPAPRSLDATGGLTLSADELLACHDDGTVYGLDRATGRERWRWGAGHCARATVAGSFAYVPAPGQAFDVLKGVGAKAPERARVRGRVFYQGAPLPRARVTAFRAEAEADAEGRFELEFAGRGRFSVRAEGAVESEAENCDPFARGESGVEALDGRGAYEVDVEAERACWCGH